MLICFLWCWGENPGLTQAGQVSATKLHPSPLTVLRQGLTVLAKLPWLALNFQSPTQLRVQAHTTTPGSFPAWYSEGQAGPACRDSSISSRQLPQPDMSGEGQEATKPAVSRRRLEMQQSPGWEIRVEGGCSLQQCRLDAAFLPGLLPRTSSNTDAQ